MEEEEVNQSKLYLANLQTLNKVHPHPDVSDGSVTAEVH